MHKNQRKIPNSLEKPENSIHTANQQPKQTTTTETQLRSRETPQL